MSDQGSQSGQNAKRAAAVAKLALKGVIKKLSAFLLKWVVPIALIVILIVMLIIGAIVSATDAQADIDGSCLVGNDYKPTTDGKPNPTVINAIWQTLVAMNASDRVKLATFETASVESGYKNYANSNVPESLKKNPDGTDKYPHDAVGSDHDSVGAFQQRVSGTWGGTGDVASKVKNLMNPGFAAGAFIKRAQALESRTPGSAGTLAQKVQVSAFPDRYDAAKATAEGYMAQAQKGTTGAAGGTNSQGVTCTSSGGLYVQCSSTANAVCTITFHNPGSAGGPLQGDKFIMALPIGTDGKPNEIGNTFKAAASMIDRGNGIWYSFGGGTLNGPSTGTCSGGNHGCNYNGFDCSSFVRYSIYQGTNKRLTIPRIASAQQHSLSGVSEPSPGDLLFYEKDGAGNAQHVTMYAGKMKYDSAAKAWKSTSDGSGTRMMFEAAHTGTKLRITQVRSGYFKVGHPTYKGAIKG